MKKSRLGVFAILVLTLAMIVGINFPKVYDNINLGLDLQGGFEIVYEVSPLDGQSEIPEMSAVAKAIQKRIDVLGVNEPEIIIEGDNRIRVQLAGVKDQDQARRVLTATANMTFRDSDDKLLMDATVIKEGGAALGFQDGLPVVSLKIADTDKFYEVTSDLAKRSDNTMIIWLDYDESVDSYKEQFEAYVKEGKPYSYISAASVNSGINGDAIISGNFTQAEAKELADLINSGSLPVKMTELYSNVVSAELGVDAFTKTVFAGSMGYLAVLIFMIAVYRLPGLISAIMLVLYLFAVLFIYNLMGGVFTLPGIAALVLGVGMTVDANVITFERIKDELYKGKSVRKAFDEGSKLAFGTIFDGQFTTFIAAVILYILGTGSVKGFATMLMITIVCTMVITVYVVKFLLGLIVSSGLVDNKKSWFAVSLKNIPDLSKGEEQKYFGPFNNIDFIGIFKKAIYVPIAIVAIALVFGLVNTFGGNGFLNLGIDFASGTKITVQADETLVAEEVKAKFAELGFETAQIQLSGDNNEMAAVSIKEAIDQERLYELKEDLYEYYGHEASDSVVTAVVGKELVRNAVYAMGIAWIAMLAYVTIRFKMDYAISCIVALIHDILIVMAIVGIFRIEVSSNLVAVILSIIGYSINDSIVMFDRIRELVNTREMGRNKEEFYRNIVNEACQQTSIRSFITTLTTLFPMLALIFFGSESLMAFNVSMTVGLIAGTYSSLFLAAGVWYLLRINHKDKPKKEKKKHTGKDEVEEWVVPGINS